MSSLFKGLASVFAPGTSFPTSPSANVTADFVKFGQVLDVILNDTSEFYSSDAGIGVIRFRLMPEDLTIAESEVSRFAAPIDKTNYRVPLPGEQVLIYTVKYGTQFFHAYGQVVQSNYNNAYNVDPFLATRAEYIEQDPLGISQLQAALSADTAKGFEKRFSEKLDIPIETYQYQKDYPPLSVREGDTILQGRWGSQIRFTSTLEQPTVKSIKGKAVGLSPLSGNEGLASGDGDPLIIMQATLQTKDKLSSSIQKAGFKDGSGLDDLAVNSNCDSAIYLASTQVIPIEIACSRTLFSWNVSVITKETSKEVDINSTALSQLIPDRWDPSDTFDINVAGIVGLPIAGNGGGGFSGGTVIKSPEGETTTAESLWNEAQKYVGWKYKLGAKPKVSNGSIVSTYYEGTTPTLDCSGFVNAVLTGPGSQQVFGRSSETTVAAGKGFRQVASLTADMLAKEGIAIGMDTGPTDFDGGRPYGIDHILLTITNPSTGQIEVWQSSGRVGTNSKSVDQAIANINKRCQRIYISDFK